MPPLELKDIQEQVHNWCSKYEPAYFPPLSILAQIQEEVGELAREINDRYGGRVKKSGEETKEIGEELCDLLFAMICMANSHKIDMSEAWVKKMSKRFERDDNRYERKQD